MAFGHPEVYILVLPSFGIYGEVISTFSGKSFTATSLGDRHHGDRLLSFTVWLHHFFTMGQDADLNAVFGIATMAIGIPTGVKDLRLDLATMFRGRIRFSVPMVYSLAFMMTFVLGGLTGILLANPPLISKSTTRSSWSRISTTC